MSDFYEFAGQHPILAVVFAVLIFSFPVAIIKALKGTDTNTEHDD